MTPTTLELATVDKVAKNYSMLMGYSESKDKKYLKIFDNWTNRIVLGYPLRYNETVIPISNERQEQTLNKLFDFQKRDVRVMSSRDYYLNRNKMGAGKTIEVIATCIMLNAHSVCICCPKTLQTQWVAQFKKWWPERAEDVRAFEFGMTPKRGDILMVNPEKLISKKSNGLFDKFVWDVVAIDEAHMIKNRDSQRSKAIKRIPAKHKYALTGTPVLKAPDDLFSIFEFLNPEIAGASYWRFAEYFCHIMEDFYGRHVVGLTKNVNHVAVLQTILENVSCYTDTSVSGAKEIIHVPLTMDSKQAKLYKNILKVELENLPDNITIPNGAVRMARLLQTTSCPKVFYDPKKDKDTTYSVGVKFEYILDMLQHNTDLKLVVYSKYERVIAQLSKYLNSHNIGVATYTGKLSEDVRNNEKNWFIRATDCRVLAGTIDALGTGVDGLQEVCHICVFIDKDTRPTINEQCEARLHRTGQKETVLCYYLECEHTIDEHVDNLNSIRAEDLKILLGD